MIFLRTNDSVSVAIVEPGNLDRLRGGKPLVTPDRMFIVCFTPDMKYFEDKVQELIYEGNLSLTALDALLKECKERKAVVR